MEDQAYDFQSKLIVGFCVSIITYLCYRLQQTERRLKELEICVPSFADDSNRNKSAIVEDCKKLVENVKELLENDADRRRKSNEKKKVKIFMDGAFDLTHYGHFNAFRQARMLGDHLVVGVNSDESIKDCKGPPILNDEERQATVLSCRFVDEIVPLCPYVMTEEYIHKIMEEYDIDYFVHGDDPCTVDGKDVYERVKSIGKFKTIARTEGVSSTDIVGRMMLLTKNVRQPDDNSEGSFLRKRKMSNENLEPARTFYPTSRMLRCFAGAISNAPPTSTTKVVYIAGEWDMFNATHVQILQKARTFGDYLYVGVHTDDSAEAYHGGRPPVFNLYERVLAIMGCKYVDDVLLGADIAVTTEQIQSFQIDTVIRVKAFGLPDSAYKAAEEMGKLKDIDDIIPLTVENIAHRIVGNLDNILAKHESKAKKEKDFYEKKYGDK